MKYGRETRKNGVVITKELNGLYKVHGGFCFSYVKLKHARLAADQVKTNDR